MLKFVPLGLLGLGMWLWLNNREGNPLGGVATPDSQDYFVVVYGYVVTVAGVFLGTAYRQLDRLRALRVDTIDDFGKLVSDIGRSVDLWMALLASPIVFALVWRTMDRNSYASVTIVALENGFACLAVISAMLRKHGTAAPTKRASGKTTP